MTVSSNDLSDQRRAELLILGVFHFWDRGLDRHKPSHGIDIMSDEGQRELESVLECLARFQPTRIGIERTQDQQGHIDQEYQAYLQGAFQLSGDEIHQIGFRLARQLGHEHIFCVNAWDRYYDPPIDFETYLLEHDAQDAEALFQGRTPDDYARLHGQEYLLSEYWPKYQAELQEGEELIKRQTLHEILLRMNSERELLKSHGMYLVDTFKVGKGHDYVGADWVTHWYNRNLRIFANLQRITDSPDDRILLVIGAGHVPILRHCGQASPEYHLAEVSDYLRPEHGEAA